jgi:tRNA (guanine37-N1)-methyltransferase
VHEHLATHEISIGDFVLSGGEIAAMAVVDAVVRQLPGALGCAESAAEESYAHGLLEAPHYTRPPEYRGWEVPDVLLSGHHAEVDKWRRRQNLLLTARHRPDLLAQVEMTEEERRWLAEEMK